MYYILLAVRCASPQLSKGQLETAAIHIGRARVNGTLSYLWRIRDDYLANRPTMALHQHCRAGARKS
jgi:hypothetical protein